MNALDLMISQWKLEGIELVAPSSESDVRAVFARLGFTAASDVIDLYTTIGGMRDMDRELWRLWPLEDIERENLETPSRGVLFSDHLISSWCYQLNPNLDDTSSVLINHFDGAPAKQVAATLAEFFEMYKADPVRLLNLGF